MRGLIPNQRLALTPEGQRYLAAWVALMVVGLYLQSNLLLLIAGLSAGPLVASLFVSAATLRRLTVMRRAPSFVFAGGPLAIDYTLSNGRRATAALAIEIEDDLIPVDRTHPDAARVRPGVTFARVPARSSDRLRWEGSIATRGRFRFGTMEVISRSPFGLLERRLTVPAPASILVYPRVGKLTRPWQKAYRESTETRRGRRHDRSAQQQEYHGLRDYRPGDSPRWIHWRTTARLGLPMVKEFEQQNEQDLGILLDPWLPRSRVTAGQREALEEAIRFVATLALETCRNSAGRRVVLGWTGPTPGVIHGPTSVRLLHEMLSQLAVLRGSSEGALASLFDVVPPPLLRDGLLVVVSTRPLNLVEEAERSVRLRGGAGRGLLGRVLSFDASRGDLAGLVDYEATADATPAAAVLAPPTPAAAGEEAAA
jgi:uncharacterized protein (DUF58 family)